VNIAVIGGSGYIGKALIARLVAEGQHTIVSLSPHADAADYNSTRVTSKNVDIFDTSSIHEALRGIDVVYYLVHMMGQHLYDFAEAETKAANSLVAAARDTQISKIIYLGGLGNDKYTLSKHLASRHHTGVLLQQSQAQIVEFRASMVIGHGSASYDIITNLVHRLPIMLLPTWAKTATQPIGLADAVEYLVAALAIPSTHNEIIEIGGPEHLSYEMLLYRYSRWKGKRGLRIHVPFVPVFIASWWLDRFTPGPHAKVGRTMVESLANPMIVTNDRAKELFPTIEPRGIEASFV